MKEQLISFETAKLAKEKGWNTHVSNYGYNNKGKEIYRKSLDKYDILAFDAPTQSLLQKWLREEFQVCVSVGPSLMKYTHRTYEVTVWFDSYNKLVLSTFKTYENALERGLKLALELM